MIRNEILRIKIFPGCVTKIDIFIDLFISLISVHYSLVKCTTWLGLDLLAISIFFNKHSDFILVEKLFVSRPHWFLMTFSPNSSLSLSFPYRHKYACLHRCTHMRSHEQGKIHKWTGRNQCKKISHFNHPIIRSNIASFTYLKTSQ